MQEKVSESKEQLIAKMNEKKKIVLDNRGITTVEVLLLLVVIIAIVVIFRTQITELVNNIWKAINSDAKPFL